MSSSSKKITLKSSDGESLEVEKAVMLELQTIKHVIEDDCTNNSMSMPPSPTRISPWMISRPGPRVTDLGVFYDGGLNGEQVLGGVPAGSKLSVVPITVIRSSIIIVAIVVILLKSQQAREIR
ncbi:hypothetical protein DVH24_018407 [Malus domestica]|uniref:SKP1 component POZ domain-containing protein n=1 Tax=Malus domestica TaxID=3750 RepID=A0A498KKS0_MALDO|nr:hypothetical protein DVH24_018407 [Malus domestica]